MKNKIILTIVILVVLGIITGVYFFRQKNEPTIDSVAMELQESLKNLPSNDLPASEEKKEVTDAKTNSQVKIQQPSETMEKEDFSIYLPPGWIETTPAASISAVAVNVSERITDPAAEKISFNTYFAVAHEALKGKTMPEYVQIFKDFLSDSIPGTIFSKEGDMTIDNKPAHYIEMVLTQNGVDLKVLSVIIGAEADDFWAISFNTVKSNWDKYRDFFYDIANTFKLKNSRAGETN